MTTTMLATDILTTPYVKAGIVLGTWLVLAFCFWFAEVVQDDPDHEPTSGRKLLLYVANGTAYFITLAWIFSGH